MLLYRDADVSAKGERPAKVSSRLLATFVKCPPSQER